MRAAVQDRYGPAREVLEIRDRPVPEPGPGQVLVRVRAAGVNPADVVLTTGRPSIVRLMPGVRDSSAAGRGQDLAGAVVGVGPDVTALAPGDEVFGEGDFGRTTGSFAEYACVPASALAPKPTGLTFEEAAAIPMVGLAALHAMRVARVGPGTHLLVNGASGGVGHLAVQIAKAHGAEVTAVCSGRNAAMVGSLGADHVVDYAREDVTRGAIRYDVILDNVNNHPLRRLVRILAPRGVLLMNSVNGGAVLGPFPRMLRGSLMSLVSRRTLRTISYTPQTKDLVELKDLVDGGELRPVIEAVYPLADVVGALERVAGKHVAGKVVVVP